MEIFDIHIHTAETSNCGKIPAAELVGLYKNLGYSGLIITDHMSISTYNKFGLDKNAPQKDVADAFLTGYRAAFAEGEKIGMKIFLGMEICVADHSDDYLLYGFDEEFVYNNSLVYKTIPEISKIAKENGYLFIQAHPYRPIISRNYLDFVDGVEIFNGHPSHNSENDKAYKLGKTISSERDFIVTSGSDCHDYERKGINCIGTGGIIFLNPVNNVTDFVNEMKAKNYRLIIDPHVI